LPDTTGDVQQKGRHAAGLRWVIITSGGMLSNISTEWGIPTARHYLVAPRKSVHKKTKTGASVWRPLPCE